MTHMMIEVTKDNLDSFPIKGYKWARLDLIPTLIDIVVKRGGKLFYATGDKAFIATQQDGKCWVSSCRHMMICYREIPANSDSYEFPDIGMSFYDRLKIFIKQLDRGWYKCVVGDASYMGPDQLVTCVCLDCAYTLMQESLMAIPLDYKGQVTRILDIIVGRKVPGYGERDRVIERWLLANDLHNALQSPSSDEWFAESTAKIKIDIDKVMREVDIMTGLEFELFLQELFQKMGYTVSLTPNSGDFGTDLILVKDGLKTSVQAKRYNAQVGITAMQEAIAGAAFYQCDYSMVITNSNCTKAAEEFAKKTGVVVWQRSDIQKALSEL